MEVWILVKCGSFSTDSPPTFAMKLFPTTHYSFSASFEIFQDVRLLAPLEFEYHFNAVNDSRHIYVLIRSWMTQQTLLGWLPCREVCFLLSLTLCYRQKSQSKIFQFAFESLLLLLSVQKSTFSIEHVFTMIFHV